MNFFRFFLLTLALLISKVVFCSDSAYICIRWNGEVDKPYHEFVFYIKGGYNPESEDSVFNSFVLQCELTELQFQELKALLFTGKPTDDSMDRSNSLFMSYCIGYFEGVNLKLLTFLNNEEDYIKIYNDTVLFFNETKYGTLIKNRWNMAFSRLGIKH